MRKPAGILGSFAKRAQQNATRTATKIVYQALFNEKPKNKRKTPKS